jgi:hypothetical protein
MKEESRYLDFTGNQVSCPHKNGASRNEFFFVAENIWQKKKKLLYYSQPSVSTGSNLQIQPNTDQIYFLKKYVFTEHIQTFSCHYFLNRTIYIAYA